MKMRLRNSQRGFTHLLLVFVIVSVAIAGASYYLIKYKSETPVTGSTIFQDQKSVASATKKETNPFTFNSVGDFSTTTEAEKVLGLVGKSDSDFTLALGDLSYGKPGSEKAWCDLVHKNVGKTHPFQIVAGNHDDGINKADIMKFASCLPNKMKDLQGEYAIEYYFDYNNLARFILISPDIDKYGYIYSKGSKHYKWVSDRIDEAHDKDLKWVVLGMHKNCITPGVKPCEIGEDVLNLAVEKKVDLILQGHEHAYFRSKQLTLSKKCPAIVINRTNAKCIAAEGSKFRAGEGTIIVITGTGGYRLREADMNDPEIGYFDKINAANSGNVHGYSKFSVSNSELSSEFAPITPGKFNDVFSITR